MEEMTVTPEIATDIEDKVSVDEATTINEDGTINIDIDKVAPNEEAKPLASDEKVADTVMSSIEMDYGNNLTEEEIISFFKLILDNHLTPEKVTNERIANDLPGFIKTEINKDMLQNGIAPNAFYTVTRELLDEIFTQANIDANFDVLDEEMQKITNMPEITDMYFEESAKNINDTIPEQYDKLVESGDIDKANQLLQIRDIFNASIDMSTLKDAYMNDNRIRKAVRKKYNKIKYYLDTFDYGHRDINGKSKLKMPKLKETYTALIAVYKRNKWQNLGITTTDIDKVITLIYWAMAFDTKKEDFMYEVKLYYTLKNISMLNYVGVDNKTDFSANFINNVLSLINLIKEEESKFNDTNKSRTKNRKR